MVVRARNERKAQESVNCSNERVGGTANKSVHRWNKCNGYFFLLLVPENDCRAIYGSFSGYVHHQGGFPHTGLVDMGQN